MSSSRLPHMGNNGVLLQMVERFVAQNKNHTCGGMLSLDLCAAFVVSNGTGSWKGSQHPNEASALVSQSSVKGTEPGVKEMFLSRALLWSSFTLTLLTVHHGRATYLVLATERMWALLMSCTNMHFSFQSLWCNCCLNQQLYTVCVCAKVPYTCCLFSLLKGLV